MNNKNGQLMFLSGEEGWLLCENYIKPLQTQISVTRRSTCIYKKQEAEDNRKGITAILLLHLLPWNTMEQRSEFQ